MAENGMVLGDNPSGDTAEMTRNDLNKGDAAVSWWINNCKTTTRITVLGSDKWLKATGYKNLLTADDKNKNNGCAVLTEHTEER
ncbi:hypothetical protein T265_10250 [Opisthorchis viverrini]|nr:hypothetical protein T265_10250 [Opisthorchis viverrini]KER21432.1 hypothetical protein T265_10250 [Opisthorchis viverrini]